MKELGLVPEAYCDRFPFDATCGNQMTAFQFPCSDFSALTITQELNQTGPIANPTTWKLTRIE